MNRPADTDADGLVRLTAVIQVHVRDVLELRARMSDPHVESDGVLVTGDPGSPTSVARAVAEAIVQAPFGQWDIEVIEAGVSAPGGGLWFAQPQRDGGH